MSDVAEVFCLAEYIAEEMDERRWTTTDVAIRMGDGASFGINCLTLELILAVQDDNLLLDDQTAKGIARAFDVSVEVIRNLDTRWRSQKCGRVPFVCPGHLFSRG